MNSKMETMDTKDYGKTLLQQISCREAETQPRLRFPEFRNEGEWKETSLGSVARLRHGYAFKSSEYVDDGNYQIITITNVQLGKLVIETSKRVATLPPDIQKHQVLSIGDILISMTGNVGRVCPVSVDGLLLNQRVGKLVPEKINSGFLYQLLQCEDFRSTMQSKAAGGAQGNLSATDVTEYTFRVPTKSAEQEKIADCLTSVDELIAAQARKVDALQIHKKGLMQELFPREGETQPRLRFPEFQGTGEWEEKSVGSAAKNLDSRRRPITSSSRKAGDVPYYGASGIVDYVEGFIFDEELLCISEDGANLVARTYPIAFPISGRTWVNNHAHVLRFENACTQKFVEVYLNSIKLDDFITGMAQPKLNKAMLDKIPIPYPELPEQQRIAGCLASLDALIAAEMQKLETIKAHKKGLMQQLFPQVGLDDA